MKGKHESSLKEFFNNIVRDDGEEFGSKISGYCVVYAPYYICFLESDDADYLDYVLNNIKNSIGHGIHDQVWCLFSTEEVPKRAFDQFEVFSFPAASSQAEVKSLPQVERVEKIYLAMLNIGTETRRIVNDVTKQGKLEAAVRDLSI